MADQLDCRLDTARSERTGWQASASAPRIALGRARPGRDAGMMLSIPARVLVLDDNMFIAMEAEELFRQLGCRDVVCVSNLPAAFEAVRAGGLDFALIDVNVGKLMSFELAEELMRRDIPFAFASGYPDSSSFPEHLRHVPLMSKPFGDDSLRSLLARFFAA